MFDNKKKDHDVFENSTKCWICDNTYVNGDAKVRYQCNITRKYRDSGHRDCNINVKLKHKLLLYFTTPKNHDFSLIMEELGKFSLKISVIPNEYEKNMSFSINNKLSFIDSS